MRPLAFSGLLLADALAPSACTPVDQSIGPPTTASPSTTTTNTAGPVSPTTGTEGEPTGSSATAPTSTTSPECRVDEDCGGFPERCEDGVCIYDYCSLSTGHCPECLNDRDCEAGFECESSQCVPADCSPDRCVAHSDCAIGRACVDECCLELLPLPPCSPFAFDAVQFVPGAPATDLALVDLDADGDLDLLLAEPTIGVLEIAQNDGAGAFVSGGQVDIGGPSAGLSLVVGDLDGDSDLDAIVARTAPDELRVFLAQAGLLDQTAVLPLAFAAHAIAVDRVDADAFPDLFAVDLAQQFPVVWRGDGLGGLKLASAIDFFATGPGLVVSDLDQDVDADLVSQPLPDAAGIDIATADVNGLYHPDATLLVVGVTRVHIADLDASSEPDLVATLTLDGIASVRAWHRGEPEDGWTDVFPLVTTAPLLGGAVFDLDNDLAPELISATDDAILRILAGHPDSVFVCQQDLPIPDVTQPDRIAVGDVTGDDRPDIVLATPTAVILLHQL